MCSQAGALSGLSKPDKNSCSVAQVSIVRSWFSRAYNCFIRWVLGRQHSKKHSCHEHVVHDGIQKFPQIPAASVSLDNQGWQPPPKHIPDAPSKPPRPVGLTNDQTDGWTRTSQWQLEQIKQGAGCEPGCCLVGCWCEGQSKNN